MDFALTRYLYPVDEVVISLIHSLIKKSSLRICYYWAFELYYSKIHIFPILWCIYYDFYAELNSTLENHIQSQYKKWSKSNGTDIKPIATIIRNFHRSIPTPNCFVMRQFILSDKATSIQNIPAIRHCSEINTLLTQFSSSYHIWIIAILEHDLQLIAHQTNYLVDAYGGKTVFTQLMRLLSIIFGAAPLIDIKKQHDKWDKAVNRSMQGGPMQCGPIQSGSMQGGSIQSGPMQSVSVHILLATILVAYHTTLDNSRVKRVFIAPDQDDIDWITASNIVDHIRSDKILSAKRVCDIDSDIGGFKLARDSLPESVHTAVQNHWLYYASKNSLWHSRITSHAGYIKHTTREVNFYNENKLQEFYKLYGYEYDEQLARVQEKTPAHIDKTTIDEWVKKMFNIDLPIKAISNIQMRVSMGLHNY